MGMTPIDGSEAATSTSVKLPKALLAALDEAAEKNGRTRSDCIREAIVIWMWAYEPDAAIDGGFGNPTR